MRSNVSFKGSMVLIKIRISNVNSYFEIKKNPLIVHRNDAKEKPK